MKNYYIAGASSRAQTTRHYLENLYSDMQISAYLVSPEMTDNPSQIDDISVLTIRQGLDTTLPVYLGTRGTSHAKLTSELCAIGFTNIIPVTVQLDSELRNAYLEKYYKEQGREFLRLEEYSKEQGQEFFHLEEYSKEQDQESLRPEDIAQSSNCHTDLPVSTTARLYIASSIYDGTRKKPYHPLPEECIIQVGSALTPFRLPDCQVFDDEGDTISALNKQFCELTGLYWIWKHAKEDYIGLEHYRRHFLLPDDWLELCAEHNIDVILPVPLYVHPNIAENYRNRHIASDWDYLMSYIQGNLPEEYENVCHILNGSLYSPCNMLIARKEVLHELCSWLFPILFAVYEHIGDREDSYQRRYPGFISERLITYYFESRREKYRVVYCNKNFLE